MLQEVKGRLEHAASANKNITFFLVASVHFLKHSYVCQNGTLSRTAFFLQKAVTYCSNVIFVMYYVHHCSYNQEAKSFLFINQP